MTDDMVPLKRPEITRAEALEMSQAFRLEEDKIFLLGRRGYYRDSMGEQGKNDINIYDDAIALVTPNRCIPFNANTDPSKIHPNVAVLLPGRYLYKLGIHGLSKPVESQYEALVQAGQVWVKRAETEEYPIGYHAPLGYHSGKGEWRGEFGINIHRGSRTTTSSEGCQTAHPSQWGDFIEKVKSTMQFYKMKFIPYILTERE